MQNDSMLVMILKELTALPVEMFGTVLDFIRKLKDPEWVAAARKFLRKEPVWAEVVAKAINFIVSVDRSVHPNYPEWVVKFMHPELEWTGPKEFDLSKVEQWLYEGQDVGVIEGGEIYNYLKSNNMLDSCLNLQDGLIIQKMGIATFRELFKGKAVFLWRSVVLDRGGYLRVPYLHIESSGLVVVDWRDLDQDWDYSLTALRHNKSRVSLLI